MVAADVGITLMPLLAVKPPIAATSNVVIKPFRTPCPNRTIALVWRKTSALAPFYESLAGPLGDLPASLLQPNI
jgi:LysR family hydrogen peroxide-inducible transcriptional activator